MKYTLTNDSVSFQVSPRALGEALREGTRQQQQQPQRIRVTRQRPCLKNPQSRKWKLWRFPSSSLRMMR